MVRGLACGSLVVLAGLVDASTASAQGGGLVLLVCDVAVLNNGTCPLLMSSLRMETADLGLTIEEGSIDEKLAAGIQLPPAVTSETRESNAAAMIWLSRGTKDGSDGLIVHVYVPDDLTRYTRLFARFDDGGEVDAGDLAFRLRTLLAASLFPELPDMDLDLPGPVPAEEAPGAPPATPRYRWRWLLDPSEYEDPPEWSIVHRRTWVRLHQGYSLMGYPTREHWYHGLSFRVAVVAMPALEVFVDAYLSFPVRIPFLAGTTMAGTLESKQYMVGAGIGYAFAFAKVVSLVPLAGFHVGISDLSLVAGGQGRMRSANAAIWTGLEGRITPVRWLSIAVDVALEGLVNDEEFKIQNGSDSYTIFGLSQLRTTVFAGICLSF